MSTINYLNIDGQRTHSLAAESKRVSYGIPLTIYNRMGPEAIYPTIFVQSLPDWNMMPGDPLADYFFTVQILSSDGERPALDADIVAEKQLSFASLVEGHNTLADKVSGDSMFSGGALPYDYHLRIKDLPTWSIGSNAQSMSGMYTGFVMRIGLKQTTNSYPFVYGCLEASIGDKWIEWYNDSRTNPIPEVWGFAYMFSHLVLDGIMVDFTMPESMRPAQCLEGMFFDSQLDFSNFNDPNSSLGFSNSLIGGKLATKHCEAMFGQRTESRYQNVMYPPRTPSKFLRASCYESMYENASLTATELYTQMAQFPAEDVPERAYYAMFANSGTWVQYAFLPPIFAKKLGNSACARMFYNNSIHQVYTEYGEYALFPQLEEAQDYCCKEMFSGTSLTAGAMFGNTLTAAAKDAFTGMLSGVNGQSEYTYTMEYGTDLSNRSCFTSQNEYDSFGTSYLTASYILNWPR